MSQEPLSLMLPAIGLFMSDDLAQFTPAAQSAGISFTHSATNLIIDDRRWRTRPRWRELTLETAPPEWAQAATQGAISYDPRVGASAVVKTNGEVGIIESAAGKLYRITPSQKTFSVTDISSGIQGIPSVRLAWLAQGSNYVIRTDEVSPTQIFDGNTTVNSTGFNPNAPSSSRFPNFAGPVCFSNRFWVVYKGNDLIASNRVNEFTFADNSDVLSFEVQSNDITSISFPAPQDMGNITSLTVVSSYRGGGIPSQAEVVAGTESGGSWGVLGGQPRTTWATTSMARVVSPQSGPVGPYASYSATDEMLMRTTYGFTSMKYVTRETQAVGNALINLASEIQPLMDKDPADLLLFTSVTVSIKQQRIACSVWPVVAENGKRYSKGFVTASLSPGRTRSPEECAWESVHTLPKSMGSLIQFIEVKNVGKRRTFALLHKEDGSKGLAELTFDWGDDLLADGTPVRIPWQMLSRRLSMKGEYAKNSFGSCYLSLTDIRDSVDVKISYRSRSDKPFKQVYASTFTNKTWKESGGYADAEPVCIGTLFSGVNDPWIEILISGTGCACVDFAILSTNAGNPDQTAAIKNACFPAEQLCTFDIFQRAD